MYQALSCAISRLIEKAQISPDFHQQYLIFAEYFLSFMP